MNKDLIDELIGYLDAIKREVFHIYGKNYNGMHGDTKSRWIMTKYLVYNGNIDDTELEWNMKKY